MVVIRQTLPLPKGSLRELIHPPDPAGHHLVNLRVENRVLSGGGLPPGGPDTSPAHLPLGTELPASPLIAPAVPMCPEPVW